MDRTLSPSLRAASAACVLLGLIASACDCGDGLRDVSETELVILTPEQASLVSHEAPVGFSANAKNPSGLKYISLQVGSVELKRCETDSAEGGRSAGDHDVTCEATFMTPDFASQVISGRFRLTALAVDARDREVSTYVDVIVRPVRIVFVEPASEAGEDIVLTGASPLKIEVTGTLPVDVLEVSYLSLDIEDATEKRLVRFSEPPYEQDVEWAALMGTGSFRLTAYARDIQGNADTAVLEVIVHCTGDLDCAGDTRCCIEDGLCYETVGGGELCDCTRPCPVWQGCFPGTCGEPPRRCRPSCDLGNFNCSINSCTPADRAERCSPEDGKPAYCTQLPEHERTEENRGAVCAPADACSALAQDCPDLPLDRTLPPGEDNPLIPHKCIPVSPSTNACVPAGPRAINQGCGGSRCGEEATEMGCVKGSTCVTLVDQNNRPIETKCLRLCTQNSHCGGFPRTCQTLYGAGWEPYSTGVCQ